MPNRTAPVARLVAVVGAALAIAACSSSSSPATSSPAAASTPSPASSSVASPATSGGAAASGALPSIPSFHQDPELEAQLPSSFCNQTATKASFVGADTADFRGMVAQLGKSSTDLSFATAAVAGPECKGLSVLAVRIKGADANQLQQLFLAVAAGSSGAPPPQSNIAGKNVWSYADSSAGTKNYIYFKGDTVFGATATTQADAEKGLSVLP